jgi:hypothetical protein
VTSQERTIVLEFVGAYLVMAMLIFGLGVAMKDKIEIISTDQEYEKLV